MMGGGKVGVGVGGGGGGGGGGGRGSGAVRLKITRVLNWRGRGRAAGSGGGGVARVVQGKNQNSKKIKPLSRDKCGGKRKESLVMKGYSHTVRSMVEPDSSGQTALQRGEDR